MGGTRILAMMPHLLIHLSVLIAVNIAGIDRAELFLELYNRARFQGDFGVISLFPRSDRDIEWARKQVGKYVDRVDGRVMGIVVPVDEDEMVTHLYNRENGDNAAEEVVKRLRRQSPKTSG